MRILAVTTWLPTPGSPSTGSFVVKDAQGIASLGHDVHLVHLVPKAQYAEGLPERDTIGGLPVTRVPMETSNPLQIARAARRLRGMAAHADLVHTMAFSSLLPMATWRPQVPWVHTEHWSGLTAPQTLPASWQKVLPVLQRLLARPDVVTAVCDYLASPIREVRGSSHDRTGAKPTAVVPCIVPVPEPVPARPADQRRLRMVSIGGLIERKDPLLAVDTLAELLIRGHDAKLTFVGQGPLREQIVERAQVFDIADRVRLTGPLDREGVLDQLARAHLFIGPTRGDNFFVSCAEALVAGRPVVVGSTGGQGEYIDPAVGQTVDTQTATAYADAVESVMGRTSGLSAQQISDTVGQRFSVDAVAAGYQDAYDLAGQQRR
ncbi:glycosyltransferase family 4 protein [Ornithinimicrobium cryptoxanthini]|uniref:Glycosyltransferase family 4 protein n=1 Tax=Ornithinimicrobium cryptoxanthini TaxID=2934161 RepID=A0ABY4YLN0_9MICO|nr:glycosyltransferase family 4 protein [Ornithinimicrobium cryptoxanthini]USQ77683.1 glycosyltransferase family 4 protein [Ornithinimicrobium cryptoxanthini]